MHILKKIAIILFLIPSLCYAGDGSRIFTISKFKGLNSHISAYLVPDGQGAVSLNVRFNDRFAVLSKRSANELYGTPGSHSIEGLHRFYRSDGVSKLIAAGSTLLYVGDDDAGTFQTIGQKFSDGKRWQFVTYKDNAIGFNGSERPIKYDGNINVTDDTDGHRTALDVVTELGASYAELNTGANLDASRWYQYKIAFFDEQTGVFLYSTARSNPILTGANVRDIRLTDIPLGPTGTDERYIFRTSGNSSRTAVLADDVYNLVHTFEGNVKRELEDTVSDAKSELGETPTWTTVSAGKNISPPISSYAIIHDEKLFAARNPSATSAIYWSETFNPDIFDARDVDAASVNLIRPQDGDEIAFIKEVIGILTIGKTTTIQKLYTDAINPENWIVSDPFTEVGCPAPYSAANTPLGIFYLAWNGLYRFNGQKSFLVSDAVTPDILDIHPGRVKWTVGHFHQNEYHLAYTSDASSSAVNDRVLVYDIVRDAYAKDTRSVDAFTSFDSGSDFGTLYIGSSGTDGKIHADSQTRPLLIRNTKTQFELGVFDDARIAGSDSTSHPHLPTGTETNFNIEIAHTITIDEASGSINSQTGDINRPDTTGSWTSPVIQIDATALEILQWNEVLSEGDATFKIRACDDAACSGESFSSAFTTPRGSDVSGITADTYIQFLIDLTTTDIDFTPLVFTEDGFLFRMFYTKAVGTQESAYTSQWTSGWTNLGVDGAPKYIKKIRVFYEGTSGTITVSYDNDKGDVSRSFAIDLSQSAGTDIDSDGTDDYTGSGVYKIFTHYPLVNTESDPGPLGNNWKFDFSETGLIGWKIHKLELEVSDEAIYD